MVKRLNITLQQNIYEKLCYNARERGLSKSAYLAELINDHGKKKPKKETVAPVKQKVQEDNFSDDDECLLLPDEYELVERERQKEQTDILKKIRMKKQKGRSRYY